MDLTRFTLGSYSHGRSVIVRVVWYLASLLLVESPLSVSWLRSGTLRAFGARVGRGVIIRRNVRVHLPWRLSIGEASWIGEGVRILNLAPVTIGRHCVVSQEAYLCTGNHDYRDPAFGYRLGEITLEDECWIGVRSLILPGVTVARSAVVTGGSVVAESVPAETVRRAIPPSNDRQREERRI